MTSAERKRLHYVADLLALAALHLRELADEEKKPLEVPRRGRPRVEPAPWQIAEVIRLRTANGRLGLRPIADQVDLSWRTVGRILEKHAASQNDAKLSQKSIPGKQGGGA